MYLTSSLIIVSFFCSFPLITTINCSIALDIATFKRLGLSVKSVILLSTVDRIITLFSCPWNLSTVSALTPVPLN